MNAEDFRDWLEALKRAWEDRDPQAAVELFSADAIYRESPFDKPLRGRDEIFEYWSHVPKTQDLVKFTYQILAVSEGKGIARWQALFQRIPTQVQVKLDGIMLVQLNAENHCSFFEEWWRRQERGPRIQSNEKP